MLFFNSLDVHNFTGLHEIPLISLGKRAREMIKSEQGKTKTVNLNEYESPLDQAIVCLLSGRIKRESECYMKDDNDYDYKR